MSRNVCVLTGSVRVIDDVPWIFGFEGINVTMKDWDDSCSYMCSRTRVQDGEGPLTAR
jgi:hypothetical protein